MKLSQNTFSSQKTEKTLFSTYYEPKQEYFSSLPSSQQVIQIGKNIFQTFHHAPIRNLTQLQLKYLIIQIFKLTKRTIPFEMKLELYKKVLDIDQDGYITQKDFEQLAQKYFESNLIKSKKMSQSIFDVSQKKSVNQNLCKASYRIFQKYDQNKNGFLDPEQIKNMIIDTYKLINQVYIPQSKQINQWIQMVNYKNKGKIDYQSYDIFVQKILQHTELLFH